MGGFDQLDGDVVDELAAWTIALGVGATIPSFVRSDISLAQKASVRSDNKLGTRKNRVIRGRSMQLRVIPMLPGVSRRAVGQVPGSFWSYPSGGPRLVGEVSERS